MKRSCEAAIVPIMDLSNSGVERTPKHDDEEAKKKPCTENTVERKEEILKTLDKPSEDGTNHGGDKNEDAVFWWTPSCPMVADGVLTLWTGTVVKNSDRESIAEFFQNVFGIQHYPIGCVETLPDTDYDGNPIDGTGGRIDYFFYVKLGDVPRFAVKRFAMATSSPE